MRCINPFKLLFDYLTHSITRLIMSTFVLVVLLPVAFLLPSLDKNAWEDVYQENLEQQLLLAKSVVNPVKLHLSSYRQSLQSLAEKITHLDLEDRNKIQKNMDHFANDREHIVAVSFVKLGEQSATTGIKDSFKDSRSTQEKKLPFLEYILSENKYRKYDSTNSISSVIKSSISNRPAIMLKHHVLDEKLNKVGTLFAELGLGFIQKTCGQISFGEKGHCVIVDSKGQIIARPDTKRVAQMDNLSDFAIVNKMKQGNSGELEYYSPTLQQDMIVGFTTIDDLSWRVMVLRPKAEIYAPFNKFMSAILTWVVAGVIFALFIAYFLTRKITKPINALVVKSREIDVRSDSFQLGEAPKKFPVEIKLLWKTISKLVVSFQESNMEVKKLNYSLNNDIRKVTAELRNKKQYLHEISNRDPLTEIANRDCFKRELGKILRLNRGERIGIILLDIDEFKYLNAMYGHNAGDTALKTVAKILHENTRSSDMAARYGGDEFIIFTKNCSDQSLFETAEKLRTLIQTHPLKLEDKTINFTLSIVTISHKIDRNLTLDFLLNYADKALHESKSSGRNIVSAYEFKDTNKDENLVA